MLQTIKAEKADEKTVVIVWLPYFLLSDGP